MTCMVFSEHVSHGQVYLQKKVKEDIYETPNTDTMRLYFRLIISYFLTLSTNPTSVVEYTNIRFYVLDKNLTVPLTIILHFSIDIYYET